MKIYVADEYCKQVLIKKTMALLSMFESYKELYDGRNTLNDILVKMLINISETNQDYSKKMDYIRSVFSKSYEDALRLTTSSLDYTDFLSKGDSASALKKDIECFETVMQKYKDQIYTQYGISVSENDIKEHSNGYTNLEMNVGYNDIVVVRYVKGRAIITTLDKIMNDLSKKYASFQNKIYSVDSAFNKRLLHYMTFLHDNLKNKKDLYDELYETVKAYELGILLYANEVGYSSQGMKNFIDSHDFTAMLNVCEPYIGIGEESSYEVD